MVVPLASRAGVTANVITALISVFHCVVFFLYAGWNEIRSAFNKNASGEGQPKRRFLQTHFGCLFLSLTLADLLLALCFTISIAWLVQDGYDDPAFPSAACKAQAALIAIGGIAASLSSMLIALHTFSILVVRWHPGVTTVSIAIGLVWLLVSILVAIGLNISSPYKGPLFTLAVGWCSIGDNYQVMRLPFLHIWIFTSSVVNIAAYSAIALSIHRHARVQNGRSTGAVLSTSNPAAERARSYDRIAKTMLVYPIAYLAFVAPLTICRILEMTGHKVSESAILAAGAVYALSGTANIWVFSITRNMINFKSLSPHCNISFLYWVESPNTRYWQSRPAVALGVFTTSSSGKRHNVRSGTGTFIPVTISYEVHRHEDFDSDNTDIHLRSFPSERGAPKHGHAELDDEDKAEELEQVPT